MPPPDEEEVAEGESEGAEEDEEELRSDFLYVNRGALNRRLAYGVWRAQKYPPDHPALADRQLAPISPQPEMFMLPPLEEEDGQGAGETGDETPPEAEPSEE